MAVKKNIVKQLKEKFDFKLWCDWLKSSPQRHIQIIGHFAEDIKPDIRSYEQGQVFIKMNVRAAKDLAVFDDDQIATAMERFLSADYFYKKDMLATLKKYLFNTL